jgi:8-oxo-dGTP pyrophosphatase MutT (NUDIX family)
VKDVINGVGLLLFEPQGKLLVLKELQDKPRIKKVSGMLSFPLETTEDGESPEETLLRLISEEIGVSLALKIREIGKFYFDHDTCIVRICMFVAHTEHVFTASPKDTDIIFHNWMYPSELLNVTLKRIEVAPILQVYLAHF